MNTSILPEQIASIKSGTCGIYMITCLVVNKRYIGSSTDIRKRLREHRGHLLRNDHENYLLQSAWNEFGESSFDFKVIETCEPSIRNKRERELIAEFGSEWNLKLPNVERDTWTASDETRQKLSKAAKGRIFTEEHKRRKAEAQIGRKLSENTRNKIANAHKGKHLSDEHKAKLSKAFAGRYVSPETRAKQSEALKAYRARMAEKSRRENDELQGKLF